MLTNTYPDKGREHLVTARVDPNDLAFLRTLFPFKKNISDIVISNLFKKFVDELRTIHADEPYEIAYFANSSTYDRIEQLVQRCSFGVAPGQDRPRDDERGAGGVRQEMHGDAEQRSDATSSVAKRGRRKNKGKEEK